MYTIKNKCWFDKEIKGWIKLFFLLVSKTERVPCDHQKGHADDYGNCMDKNHMGQWL